MSRHSLSPSSPAKSQGERGLPAGWKRGRVLAALGTLALCALVLALAREGSQAEKLDSWWLRARFALREKLRPIRPDSQIVIVTLDDKCTRNWPEPTLFWGPHLAQGVNQITRGGAKLVALDWIQPISLREVVREKGARGEAARGLFDSYDEGLGRALGAAPHVVMVKLFAGDDKKGDWIRPTSELLYSLPDAYGREEAFLGYAELNSRESIVASQMPVSANESTNFKVPNGYGTVLAAVNHASIAETSFAARIAERALGGRWKLSENRLQLEGSSNPVAQRAVPLRADGSLLINYAPGVGGSANTSTPDISAFATYSLFDVASGRVAAGAFKDKIVLIGATFTGSNDFHYVPVLQRGEWSRARLVPGVEIQAHLTRTLLSARPITEVGSWARWSMALALAVVALGCFAIFSWGRAALAVALVGAAWLGLSAWSFVRFEAALPLGLPLLGLGLASALMGGYRALGEERQRQQILKLWGRYQHPRIVDYYLRNPHARGGEGQEARITVLFADLKNFTKTVEHLPPGDAIRMLNRYLGLMQETVEQFDGYVDKFLGDGLLAQWGAPEPWDENKSVARHEEAALRACIELQRRTAELTAAVLGESGSDELKSELKKRDVTFGLRLTLHSGPAIAGWVGADRIEYTIIGDTVNVCSRMQETAKELDCELLISESTYEAVRDIVQLGRTAEVEIRGRVQPLCVVEITGLKA